MSILVIMIPLSLLFVFGAGVAFFWAVNHDQFDDMDSPALLPVSDDLPDAESGASHTAATAPSDQAEANAPANAPEGDEP